MKEKEMMGLSSSTKAHKNWAEFITMPVVMVASLLQVVQNKWCFVLYGLFNCYMIAVLAKAKRWGLVGAYVFLLGTAIWGFIAWGN